MIRSGFHIILLSLLFAQFSSYGQELGTFIDRANRYFESSDLRGFTVEYRMYRNNDFTDQIEKKTGDYVKQGHRYVMRMDGNLNIQDDRYNVTANSVHKGVILASRDTGSSGLIRFVKLEDLKPLFESVTYLGKSGDTEGFLIKLKSVPGNEIATFQVDFDVKYGFLSRIRLQYRTIEMEQYGGTTETLRPSVEIVYKVNNKASAADLLESSEIISWNGQEPILATPYRGYSLINNIRQ